MRPSERIIAELAAGLGVRPEKALQVVQGFLQRSASEHAAGWSSGDLLADVQQLPGRLDAAEQVLQHQALVRGVLEWLATVKDAARLAEYDWGPPRLYVKASDVTGLTGTDSRTLEVPVPASGEVDWFGAFIQRIGNADAFDRGFVAEVSIGGQAYYQNLGGTPENLGVPLPYFYEGFKRRITVAQSDIWRVSWQTLAAADTYRVTFAAVQYFTPVS